MAYNDDVIVINVQERGFKDILEKVKTLNSLLNKPWAVAKGLKNDMGLSRTSELVEKTGKSYDQMWASINKEIDTTYDNFQKKQIKYDVDKEKKIATDRVNAAKETERAMMKMDRHALQAGLSIMFFGMQVKRTLMNIATQSFNTFNKFTVNTELANNSLNRMSGALDYVRYTLADAISTAIEPLEPLLMSIVEWVTNLIETNPELVAWGIALGIGASALLEVVGQIGLFIIGIEKLGPLLIKLGFAKLFSKTFWADLVVDVKLWWKHMSNVAKIVYTEVIKSIKNIWTHLKNIKNLEVVKSLKNWITTGMVPLIAKWTILIAMVVIFFGLITGQEPIVKMVRNFVTGIATIVMAFSMAVRAIGMYWIEMWDKLKSGTLTMEDLISPKVALESFTRNFTEGMNFWKPEIAKLGDTFEDGLMTMTDMAGITKGDGQWNNIFEDLGFGVEELTKNIEKLDSASTGSLTLNLDQTELTNYSRLQLSNSEQQVNLLSQNNNILERYLSNPYAGQSTYFQTPLVNVPYVAPNQ